MRTGQRPEPERPVALGVPEAVDRFEGGPPSEQPSDGGEYGKREGPLNGDERGGRGDRLDQAEKGRGERGDPLRVTVAEDQHEGYRSEHEGERIQEISSDDQEGAIPRRQRERRARRPLSGGDRSSLGAGVLRVELAVGPAVEAVPGIAGPHKGDDDQEGGPQGRPPIGGQQQERDREGEV